MLGLSFARSDTALGRLFARLCLDTQAYQVFSKSNARYVLICVHTTVTEWFTEWKHVDPCPHPLIVLNSCGCIYRSGFCASISREKV